MDSSLRIAFLAVVSVDRIFLGLEVFYHLCDQRQGKLVLDGRAHPLKICKLSLDGVASVAHSGFSGPCAVT